MKERLKEYLKISRITQREFCDTIGVVHSYLSSINKDIPNKKLLKIKEIYPDLNIEWLMTGRGNMLNTPQQAMSVTNYGTNSGTMGNNVCMHTGTPCPSTEDSEVEELPVIPSNIVNEPQIDVLNYIRVNDTDTQPIVKQFPEAIAYYKIKSKAMEPYICSSDILAIMPYPKGKEYIVPGDPYVVDTNTNGLVTRILYDHPDGYRAVSHNPERYPDYVIPREHIIRIYRIVGLLRQNII